MTESCRVGMRSRQLAASGAAALAATTRPFGAPFVVCTISVSSTTVPNACPSVPTDTDAPFDPAGAKKPLEVHEPEVVGLRVHPVAEQEPAAVARKRPERSPRRRELLVLGLGELPEEHDVARDVLPHAVEHDLTAVWILRVLQVLVHESDCRPAASPGAWVLLGI